ncbi:MAG: non-homologous end-joining DNA ligase [Oligoflexia bacterium]|nr:non-homologous end-joining DNA ligase [Oligoflexia bacterium]
MEKSRPKRLELTKPSKVLFPDPGITKADLAEYYASAAGKMLPHIAERPLMLLRCPDGYRKKGFFQKNWNKTLPASIKKLSVKYRGESSDLLMIDSAEGIIELAQLAVLEVHLWNTHADHPESPDQFVFDIDPSEGLGWREVRKAALLVRRDLRRYGLRSFAKVTGGKGLHVVAPVLPFLRWELGKDFCRAICQDLTERNPDLFLVNMSLARRAGKIFLDYLRNGRGATSIAPYSPRARPRAPLAMPVSWEELGPRPLGFPLTDSGPRLSRAFKDPWSDSFKLKQFPTRSVMAA